MQTPAVFPRNGDLVNASTRCSSALMHQGLHATGNKGSDERGKNTVMLIQCARCGGTGGRCVTVPGNENVRIVGSCGLRQGRAAPADIPKNKTGNPQKHDRNQAYGVSHAGSVCRQKRHHSPSVHLSGTGYRTRSGRRDFIRSSGVLNGSSSSQYLPRSSGRWESDPTDTGLP